MNCFDCNVNMESLSLQFCHQCGARFARSILSTDLSCPTYNSGATFCEQLTWSSSGFAWDKMATPLRWIIMPDGGFMVVCRGRDGQFRVFVLRATESHNGGVPSPGLTPRPELTLELGTDVVAIWPRRRGCLVIRHESTHYFQLNSASWVEVPDFNERVGNQRAVAATIHYDGSMVVATGDASTHDDLGRIRLWHERRHLGFIPLGDVRLGATKSLMLLQVSNSAIGRGVGVVGDASFALLGLNGIKHGESLVENGHFDSGVMGALARDQITQDAKIVVLCGQYNDSDDRFACTLSLATGETVSLQKELPEFGDRLASVSGPSGISAIIRVGMIAVTEGSLGVNFTTGTKGTSSRAANATPVLLRDAVLVVGVDGNTGRLEVWQNGVVPVMGASLKLLVQGQGAGEVLPNTSLPAIASEDLGVTQSSVSLFFLASEPPGGQVGWRVIRLKLGDRA
jgi:hypothetical protein